MFKRTKYTLGNGVKMHAESPETFWIPSDEVKAKLKVGDIVKLVFIPSDRRSMPERLWVKITVAAPGGNFAGLVDNYPMLLEGVDYGDTVAFRAEHIINVYDEAIR